MVEQHVESGAGVTVAAIRQPIAHGRPSSASSRSRPDDPTKIQAFREKPADPDGLPDSPDEILASMGNYVFDAQTPHRRRDRRRDAGRLEARHGRRHRPGPGRGGRRLHLRLQEQRHPRRHRARHGLLARRRHDGLVLRRAHGPRVDPPDLQPLQLRLADLHLARPVPAGEVRPRPPRPLRRGPQLGRLPRRRHLGRPGQRLGRLPQRQRAQLHRDRQQRRPRRRADRPALPHPAGRSSTRTSSSRTARRSASTASTTSRAASRSPSPASPSSGRGRRSSP